MWKCDKYKYLSNNGSVITLKKVVSGTPLPPHRKNSPPWGVRVRARVRLGIALGLGSGGLFFRRDFFLETKKVRYNIDISLCFSNFDCNIISLVYNILSLWRFYLCHGNFLILLFSEFPFRGISCLIETSQLILAYEFEFELPNFWLAIFQMICLLSSTTNS